MLSVVLERLGLARLDHDRAVDAGLLLEVRVRVIPVRAALARAKAIVERLTRRDAVEAHAGHAVHVRGRQHAVPMDRGVYAELVAHTQRDIVSFSPAQDRARQSAVRERRGPRRACEVHLVRADREIDHRPAQRRNFGLGCGLRHPARQPRAHAREHATRGQPLNESTPRRLALERPCHSFALRNRSALPITETDDRLIARLASAGDSSKPSAG